jgi:hypothetical protein
MKSASPTITYYFFAGLLVLSLDIFSQNKLQNKESFLEAESFFIHEEFNEALPLYIQLKEKYPANYNLDYLIGRCYLYMPYEKKKAISYLEKAVKHINPEYKEGKFSENGAPNEANFYLADAYRVNNQLEKAIATYKSFKSSVTPETYDVELIDHQIKNCYRAIDAKRKPLDVDVTNLGNIINSRNSETNPVVTPNEDVIVYSSILPFYKAVFYSRKVNGTWTTPINIIPELQVDDDCVPTSISYDGTELYFYRTNDYLGDIYVSNLVNNKWTKIRKLNANINTKYWESHASLSRDGKTLYFTSNREGGYGGLDIYKSGRTSGDNWGPAINLGPLVNSEYNEESPFLTSEGNRLYFSSFGHESMGGYDVFYSDLNSKGQWQRPKNLGYLVNSTDDDLFYYPIRDGSIAYISTFDPNGLGKNDIVRLNVYTYENPRIYNISGKAKQQLEINSSKEFYIALYDKVKRDTILRKKFNSDEVSFEATPGNYDVIIFSKDGQFQRQPLNINWGSKSAEITLDYSLKPKEKEDITKTEILADNKKDFNTNELPSSEKESKLISLVENDKQAAVINKDLNIDSDTSKMDKSSLITSNSNSKDLTTGESANNGKSKGWFAKNILLISLFSTFILIAWLVFKRRKKGDY